MSKKESREPLKYYRAAYKTIIKTFMPYIGLSITEKDAQHKAMELASKETRSMYPDFDVLVVTNG